MNLLTASYKSHEKMNTAFYLINHSKNNFKTRKGVSHIDESLYLLDLLLYEFWLLLKNHVSPPDNGL